MKFYPQDWRADEKLRLCSLAARGLWMEMLSIMHRSERYGQLLIGGRVPTDAQLAVQAGALPDEVSTLLVELEDAGVFSRAASGAIYSRRMTRDHKKAQNARKNGKLGGNPSLGNKKGKSAPDNLPDNGGDKAQKPEARSQSLLKQAARAETDLPSLAHQLCRAAGIEMPDPGRNFARHSEVLSLVEEWVTSGVDAEKAVQCVAARAAVLATPPRSLRYFDGAVRDMLKAKNDDDNAALRLMDSILAKQAAAK